MSFELQKAHLLQLFHVDWLQYLSMVEVEVEFRLEEG